MPHRINLSAAWQYRPDADGPAWTRPFGRPTGLDGGDRVALVFTALAPAARVVVNDETLAPADGTDDDDAEGPVAIYDVTGRLAPRNVIRLVLPAPGGGPGDPSPPFDRVALAIVPVGG